MPKAVRQQQQVPAKVHTALSKIVRGANLTELTVKGVLGRLQAGGHWDGADKERKRAIKAALVALLAARGDTASSGSAVAAASSSAAAVARAVKNTNSKMTTSDKKRRRHVLTTSEEEESLEEEEEEEEEEEASSCSSSSSSGDEAPPLPKAAKRRRLAKRAKTGRKKKAQRSSAMQSLYAMARALSCGPSVYRGLQDISDRAGCDLLRKRLKSAGAKIKGKVPTHAEINVAKKMAERKRMLDGLDQSLVIESRGRGGRPSRRRATKVVSYAESSDSDGSGRQESSSSDGGFVTSGDDDSG